MASWRTASKIVVYIAARPSVSIKSTTVAPRRTTKYLSLAHLYVLSFRYDMTYQHSLANKPAYILLKLLSRNAFVARCISKFSPKVNSRTAVVVASLDCSRRRISTAQWSDSLRNVEIFEFDFFVDKKFKSFKVILFVSLYVVVLSLLESPSKMYPLSLLSLLIPLLLVFLHFLLFPLPPSLLFLLFSLNRA